jgi:aryl-alcohol dehydrogenase-like predicted oxidoreductase
MKYKALGNTGLYVSQLCMGTMTFGRGGDMFGDAMNATGEQVAQQMVDRAFDAGINFFDTANGYSFGQSEEMLGKAIGGRRDKAIIATKVYFPFDGDQNSLGVSRKAIHREVEASLKRLRTDYIDLYQIHSFDLTTPLEETLLTLNDLVRAGKVRYIGISNFAGWQIAKAQGVARQLGAESFCSLQAYYSLAGRELEYEVLPAVRDARMGVMVWSPLAGGYLSGKYTNEGEQSGRRKHFGFPPVDPAKGDEIVTALRAVGEAHDASPARIALAWLLHQDAVTSVIIGASKLHQLEDNLGAVEIELTEAELQRLDEVSKPAPLYCWQFGAPRGVTMEEMWTSLS